MLEDSSSRKNYPSRWWEALSFGFSTIFLSILVVGILSTTVLKSESELSTNLIYVISSLVMLISSILFLRVKKVNLKDFFGKPEVKYMLLLPVFYVAYIALSKVAQSIVGLLPGVDLNQTQEFGLNTNSPAHYVFIFITLVLLPPLSEEILFRGVLYRSFRGKFGKILSALIISGLFGLAHGQWNVAADTFVLSLILIYLVEKSRSLWPSIALHFMKNLIAYLLVFVFKVT